MVKEIKEKEEIKAKTNNGATSNSLSMFSG